MAIDPAARAGPVSSESTGPVLAGLQFSAPREAIPMVVIVGVLRARNLKPKDV